jgi:hypothetical protein
MWFDGAFQAWKFLILVVIERGHHKTFHLCRGEYRTGSFLSYLYEVLISAAQILILRKWRLIQSQLVQLAQSLTLPLGVCHVSAES